MNAMQRLNKLILDKNSRICAGLDPNWEEILKLKKCENMFFQPDVLAKYCSDYIDSIYDIVPAIKINIAFFERLHYWDMYFEVANYAKEKGLFVIGDVKRGDIGSTSQAYADAYVEKESPFDAITINPYFGSDGVKPFIKLAKENGKGVFVLVKTSNKSSNELQDLELKDGKKVYEVVADLVENWAEELDADTYCKSPDYYSMIGAVVGATHPKQAERIWKEYKGNIFGLIPGYGTLGATADDVAVNFDYDGLGAIVNSSRGIMQAYKKDCWKDEYSEETWTVATRAEAIHATKEINEAINRELGRIVCAK